VFERRRARILLAALVLVTLVLVTVDYRAGGGGPVATLREFASDVFGPIQDGVSAVLRPVRNFINGIGDLFSARTDVHELQQRIDELEEEQASISDLQREIASLRALLAMDQEMGLETVTAEVIGAPPSNFEYTVTIDVGTDDGVREDMVVVAGDGLVGRIVQATSNASRVLLAIDKNFAAAVRVASSGEQGIVTGGGSEPMRLELVDPDAPIEVGDEIVTSSYEGGTFPDGVPVGTVEALGGDELSRTATVRQYIDFTKLDFVLVIIRGPVRPPPPPVDPDEATATPTSTSTPTGTATSTADPTEPSPTPPSETEPAIEPTPTATSST